MPECRNKKDRIRAKWGRPSLAIVSCNGPRNGPQQLAPPSSSGHDSTNLDSGGRSPGGADPRSGLRGCKVFPGHGARFAPSEIQEIHIFGQELHNSGQAERSCPKLLMAPHALTLHTRVHPHEHRVHPIHVVEDVGLVMFPLPTAHSGTRQAH